MSDLWQARVYQWLRRYSNVPFLQQTDFNRLEIAQPNPSDEFQSRFSRQQGACYGSQCRAMRLWWEDFSVRPSRSHPFVVCALLDCCGENRLGSFTVDQGVRCALSYLACCVFYGAAAVCQHGRP